MKKILIKVLTIALTAALVCGCTAGSLAFSFDGMLEGIVPQLEENFGQAAGKYGSMLIGDLGEAGETYGALIAGQAQTAIDSIGDQMQADITDAVQTYGDEMQADAKALVNGMLTDAGKPEEAGEAEDAEAPEAAEEPEAVGDAEEPEEAEEPKDEAGSKYSDLFLKAAQAFIPILREQLDTLVHGYIDELPGAISGSDLGEYVTEEQSAQLAQELSGMYDSLAASVGASLAEKLAA